MATIIDPTVDENLASPRIVAPTPLTEDTPLKDGDILQSDFINEYVNNKTTALYERAFKGDGRTLATKPMFTARQDYRDGDNFAFYNRHDTAFTERPLIFNTLSRSPQFNDKIWLSPALARTDGVNGSQFVYMPVGAYIFQWYIGVMEESWSSATAFIRIYYNQQRTTSERYNGIVGTLTNNMGLAVFYPRNPAPSGSIFVGLSLMHNVNSGGTRRAGNFGDGNQGINMDRKVDLWELTGIGLFHE